MIVPKTHGELAAERAHTLEELLPLLFKDNFTPSAYLVRNIAIHMSIGKRPELLQNPRSVRAESAKIYEDYGADVEVVHDNMEERQALCPISQSPVITPWVGTCGHVFEERVVQSYIESKEIGILGAKKRTKSNSKPVVSCPVIGCNKLLVRKADPSG